LGAGEDKKKRGLGGGEKKRGDVVIRKPEGAPKANGGKETKNRDQVGSKSRGFSRGKGVAKRDSREKASARIHEERCRCRI